MSSINVQKMVERFHKVFGQPVLPAPALAPEDRAALRLDLIEEEFNELQAAVNDDDIIEIADALADLAYVVYGTAAEYGIDLDPVIQEVHESNMLKLQPDGEVDYDENGKVRKPDYWAAPDIRGVLEEQGL